MNMIRSFAAAAVVAASAFGLNAAVASASAQVTVPVRVLAVNEVLVTDGYQLTAGDVLRLGATGLGFTVQYTEGSEVFVSPGLPKADVGTYQTLYLS